MGMVCPNLDFLYVSLRGLKACKLDWDEAGKFGGCYFLTVSLTPRNRCFFCFFCCMVALTSPWKGAKVFLLQHSTCLVMFQEDIRKP